MRLITMKALREEKGVPFSRQWIHRLVKDGQFPKPIQCGANRIAFLESEVDTWIKDRMENREAA